MIEKLKIDCMKYMKTLPDNAFDLGLVDPNYGLGASKPSKKREAVQQKNGKKLNVKSPEYKHKDWDDKPADKKYFDELFRVTKNQIIWGVNFYDYVFGSGRLIWDKMNDYSDQFDCEIAYISSNNRTDIVRYMWAGMMQGKNISKSAKIALEQQGNKLLNETRIHPTQKPVKLYSWILEKYVKKHHRVLDTHGGSFSSAIAAHYFGCDMTICEIDHEIFEMGVARFEKETRQIAMF